MDRALTRCLARYVMARTSAERLNWLAALERLATWGNLSGLLTPEWAALVEEYLEVPA